MSNDIVTQEQFSQEDIALIKETVCKGATDTEFKLFINQARTTGLNPLARQVFAVMRWDGRSKKNVMSIQVSIDGFRLIAERTGKYAGQVGPQWCGEDGVWRDVWLSDMPPVAARVGALRNDFKEPCWGVARFGSYAQKDKEGHITRMWANMPDVMIAKCAESLALRKAFPQELSGLYTNDEMGQIENEPQKSPAQQWAETPPSMPVTIEHKTEENRLKAAYDEFKKRLDACETSLAVSSLVSKNNPLLLALKEKEPAMFESLSVEINKATEACQMVETAEVAE